MQRNTIGNDVAFGIRRMADGLDNDGVVWLHEFMWTIALLSKDVTIPSTGSRRWPVEKMRELLHRFADCLTDGSDTCATAVLQEFLSPEALSERRHK